MIRHNLGHSNYHGPFYYIALYWVCDNMRNAVHMYLRMNILWWNRSNFQYSRHQYIRRGTQTLKDEPHWIQSALEKISVHGLIWYQRSNSKIIRSCIVIFALFVLFGLPTWTVFEFIKFYQTIQIKTVTEASRDSVFRYPNLTVCHSRYFDNQLLKGLLFAYQLK